MPTFRADFTGVNVGGKRFPVGSFRATIDEVELQQSKNGFPMLRVTFASAHKGVTARQWNIYSLQKQSLFALKRLLLATGDWEQDDLNGELDVDTDDMVGCTVGIVVEPAKDNKGNPTTEIVAEIPADSATGIAPESSAVESLETGAEKKDTDDVDFSGLL